MLPIIAAILLCSGPTFAQSVGEKTGVSAVLGALPAAPSKCRLTKSADGG